jgi:hypothetical protein
MHYEDSLEPHPADMGRPPQVPEKFWDPQAGAIRTEALLRAYQDLERRMHTMVKVPGDDCTDDDLCAFRRALGIPDSPDGYQIECRHDMLASDPEINRQLHEHGFTPEQAQLVYDLAHERVVPAFERLNQEHDQRRHLDKLKDHFGGEARWGETARQVSAWGKANLPAEVYDALSRSAEGIVAMERMMASGEPAMGRAAAPREESLSEAELKKLMQDPRYWKKRDPAFIEKVSAGFRKLYGEE